MTDRTRLEALLRSRSVLHGDFQLSSGKRTNHYIDARKTTMSAEGFGLIGRLGLAAIREAGWAPSKVGGLTMGADPVAYAVARSSLDDPPVLDAFSVRKGLKQHGTRRRIEGNFEPGDSVVVVEDVITSGASALDAVAAIQDEGGTVLGVLAVVDREEGGRRKIEATVPVLSLTTTGALLAG